jgi:hypothetical protein
VKINWTKRMTSRDSSGEPDDEPRGKKRGGKVVKAKGKKPHRRLDKKARGGDAKWIQGAIKHPGALHKSLHVPSGEKIPEAKLNKAAHSSNPVLRKRAVLAKTLKRINEK